MLRLAREAGPAEQGLKNGLVGGLPRNSKEIHSFLFLLLSPLFFHFSPQFCFSEENELPSKQWRKQLLYA